MKYEVRMPDGELVGTLESPDDAFRKYICIRTMNQPLFKMLNADPDDRLHVLETQDVELEKTRVMWTGNGKVTEIPTLILTSGKKSWLRSHKGFRGLR